MTDAEKIARLKEWIEDTRNYPLNEFDEGYEAAAMYVEGVIND